MTAREPWFASLRALLVGKPDGVLVRLRCRLFGHRWWPCDAGCCNRWWCERCLVAGPTLDVDRAVLP